MDCTILASFFFFFFDAYQCFVVKWTTYSFCLNKHLCNALVPEFEILFFFFFSSRHMLELIIHSGSHFQVLMFPFQYSLHSLSTEKLGVNSHDHSTSLLFCLRTLLSSSRALDSDTPDQFISNILDNIEDCILKRISYLLAQWNNLGSRICPCGRAINSKITPLNQTIF